MTTGFQTPLDKGRGSPHEKREALNAWSAQLEKILAGKAGDTVVAFAAP